jgi:hypothetical protein
VTRQSRICPSIRIVIIGGHDDDESAGVSNVQQTWNKFSLGARLVEPFFLFFIFIFIFRPFSIVIQGETPLTTLSPCEGD